MSNSVISLGIAVDGENTFKSALQAIDAQIKALGAGVKTASAEMEGMGNKEEAAAKKAELLTQTIAANNEKLKLLGEQYAAAQKKLDGLADALKKAQESGDPEKITRATNEYNRQVTVVANLERSMASTQTAIQNAANSMQQAQEQTNAMSDAMGQTGKNTEELGKNMEETGKQTDELAKKLDLSLAKEGLENVNSAIGAAISKLKEWGTAIWEAGKNASTMADDLITMSTKTGMSVEKLQEMQYAARFVDTELNTITGSMTKLTSSMTSGSAAVGEAFMTLGVRVTDNTGALKTQEQVFWECIDALGKVANETERDAIAMTLFGKSAGDLTPLIKAGSAEWNAYAEEARKAGIIISQDGVSALGTFNDSLQRMEATFDGVKNQLLSALAPAFSAIADKVTEVAQKFSEWVQTDEAQEMLANIAQTVMDLVTELGNNLQPAIDGVIGAAKTVGEIFSFIAQHGQELAIALGVVTTAIVGLKIAQLALNVAMMANPIGGIVIACTAAVAAIAGLAALIASNIETIKSWFNNLSDSIANAFRTAINAVTNAWNAIPGFFQNLWNGVVNIFNSAKEAIQNAWNSVPQFFQSIRDGIQNIWQNIDSWMTEKFGAAWEGIKRAFEPFVEFFRNIWETVKGIFAVVGDVLSGNFSDAWERIKSIFSNWGQYFQGLWDTLVKGFAELPGKIWEIGKNIVTGLWDGIQSMANWLWDQLTEWCNGIIDGIKGFFGIHSPSTLMRDEIGKNLGLGVAEGIIGSAAAVQKAYSAFLPGASTFAAGSDSYSVAARQVASGGDNFYQDNRPVILRLNDRELGRAVRGYV